MRSIRATPGRPTPLFSGGTLQHQGPPTRCHPLSREVIRHDLEKLEFLGFFGRCSYARGPCGGNTAYTAYTARHPVDAALLAGVQAWAADKNARKTKIAANRGEDLAAFRGMKTEKPRSAA